MKTISNSIFPAYDTKNPMVLDEVAMALVFRNAIAHGETYVGALLADGHIVFADVNRQTLRDVFQLKNGSMYAGEAGVIRCAAGNDQESIIRELTGKAVVPEGDSFRQVAHSL